VGQKEKGKRQKGSECRVELKLANWLSEEGMQRELKLGAERPVA
jgi:hypothetical protein